MSLVSSICFPDGREVCVVLTGKQDYDSYYCIWDSFRSIHPLITMLDPTSQARMVRSLIDIYKHEGKLPDCRMSLCKGYTQGGSNADVVLADAYVKNITEGIDWELGYEAVVSDAEDEPPIWGVEGRGGLMSWKTLNYIPTEDFDPYGAGPQTRSISRNVEYAYNDFCIAEMAAGLGKTADEEKYLERSTYWKNMVCSKILLLSHECLLFMDLHSTRKTRPR